MPEPKTYINKRAAAARAGLSARRILELATEGKLRYRRQVDPRTHQRAMHIEEQSLDEYIDAHRRAPEAVPCQTPARVSPAEDLAEKFSLVKAALQPPRPAPEPKRWMTLSEAADYLGSFPAANLLERILSGSLPAEHVGRRNGCGIDNWIVRRADLDAIEGAHQVLMQSVSA